MLFQAAPATHSVLGLPFGWGAIFSFLGVIVSTLLGGGVLGMWIKTRAENKKVEQDGETQLRNEMWKDIERLKTAKEDTSRRLTLAETQIAGQTVRLGQQAFVINMLLDELDVLSPGNTIARSARMLLKIQADAMPEAEEVAPMAEVMSKLCKEPGEGEDDEKPA